MRLSHALLAMIVEELMDGATTSQDLVERTGMRLQTINQVLRAFHKQGVIHVCGWEKDANGRTSIRAYKLGRERDAKKPVSKRAQINRSYRERKQVNAARAVATTQAAA